MATVLGVPGRFGERSLHRSDIRAASAAPGTQPAFLRTIERIWDRIKDWFCNSNLREAKDCLAILYDPATSDRDKVAAFVRLKGLVGPAYLDRFRIVPAAFGYELRIDYGSDIAAYAHSVELCDAAALASKLNDDVAAAAADPALKAKYRNELARDLARATYSIDGERIPDLAPDQVGHNGKVENLEAALSDRLKVTPEQLAALTAISYQKLFAMMMQSSLDLHGQEMAFDLIQIRGDGDSALDFARKGDDIELHASFVSGWQLEETERTTFLRAPVHDARILVAPDGEVTVTSAVCGASPGE